MVSVRDAFDLSGRVVVITGGAGLLGREHAAAVAEAGGTPVLADLDGTAAEQAAAELADTLADDASGAACDVTSAEQVEALLERVLERHGRVDALVNNAARDPKAGTHGDPGFARVEAFPEELWSGDIAVGLTGAFLCSRTFGAHMARHGGGSIVNVASDLAVVSPDQRLYRLEDVPEEHQPVKPVSYSVVKTGLLGLTRYLATYWAEASVRVNAISPGGVFADQPDEFVQRLTRLIPMGRMAARDEYRGAIVFLCADASSYMTGQNLVVDGGRTVW